MLIIARFTHEARVFLLIVLLGRLDAAALGGGGERFILQLVRDGRTEQGGEERKEHRHRGLGDNSGRSRNSLHMENQTKKLL